MKLFITLLIIFLVILIIGIFSYAFLLYIINKKNKEISWKIKYLKQLIIGVIIFSIAGIAVNLINYFN